MVDDLKGGYERDGWVHRCSDILQRFGYQAYPAFSTAENAWSEADEWMTPDEAAHEELVAGSDS